MLRAGLDHVCDLVTTGEMVKKLKNEKTNKYK